MQKLFDLEKNENDGFAALSYTEKNRLLFEKQKALLDQFLKTGAISQSQHDKSLHDLVEKMGITEAV